MMAFRIHADEKPTSAVRRIAHEQIDKVIEDMDDDAIRDYCVTSG
jgi:hypothetical protein